MYSTSLAGSAPLVRAAAHWYGNHGCYLTLLTPFDWGEPPPSAARVGSIELGGNLATPNPDEQDGSITPPFLVECHAQPQPVPSRRSSSGRHSPLQLLASAAVRCPWTLQWLGAQSMHRCTAWAQSLASTECTARVVLGVCCAEHWPQLTRTCSRFWPTNPRHLVMACLMRCW